MSELTSEQQASSSTRAAPIGAREVLHLVLPGGPVPKPSLTFRPRRWSKGWRRAVQGSDAAVWACKAMIDATPEIRHQVCIVGGNDAGRRSLTLGLESQGRIAPPFARPELAAAGLKNWIAEHGEPDIIQCWGSDFAALRDRLIEMTPRASWMVVDMQAGVLEVRDGTTPREPLTQALTPWLPVPSAPTQRARDQIRERLGVRHDSLLLGLIGDPPSAVDAVTMIYAVGILHVGAVRATPVFPRGSGQLDRALRHISSGGYVQDFRLIDEPISMVAGACDLGLCVPMPALESEVLCEPGFATKLAVAHAAAQGLPVVMPATPWAEGLMPEGAKACLAPSMDHAALAKRIYGLLQDDARPLRACRAALIEQSVNAPARGLVQEVAAAWSKVLARGAGRPAANARLTP